MFYRKTELAQSLYKSTIWLHTNRMHTKGEARTNLRFVTKVSHACSVGATPEVSPLDARTYKS